MNDVDLRALAAQEQEQRQGLEYRVLCCASTPCIASGIEPVRAAIEDSVKAAGLDARVKVVQVGCMGLCSRGPLVAVEAADQPPTIYESVTPDVARRIVDEHARQGKPVVQHLLPGDLPFFAKQTRVVLSNSGSVDPERIEEYLAAGGYQSLEKAVTQMSSEQVVEEVTRSGLRGRGGAGFSTGVKWGLVARAKSDQKYVVCNGDEGDPGAYMDRTVMEADPHRVLEGMAIAAYAVGANQGYVYVRGEYPLAVKRLEKAIRQAERQGVLGARIFDTPFQFRVDIRIGAGAFVCGEETALIASVEGGRGIPRPRPPFPAQSGVWGKPTLINNVETYASVPTIVERGGAWYAKLGTEKSKGTKVFALAGKVKNTGLIEVPMGITIREVVFDVGGGIVDDRPFKAVLTGGPSGGCIPADLSDLPIDYETLAKAGSIVGSGGLIVMDDTSCMVDVARYYMDFCVSESCGKCVPCRAGTVQTFRLLQRISRGEGTLADLELLETLCRYMQEASLCGLGQSAPNPVLSTLRYFREEYLAHIERRTCPAGVCTMARDTAGALAEVQA